MIWRRYDTNCQMFVLSFFFSSIFIHFCFVFFFVLWLIDPTASGSLRTGQEEWKIRRASLLVDVHHLEFIFSILGDRTCLELAHTAVTSSTFTGYSFHCITSKTFFTFEFIFAKKREDLNPRTRWRSLWTSETNFQTDRRCLFLWLFRRLFIIYK